MYTHWDIQRLLWLLYFKEDKSPFYMWKRKTPTYIINMIIKRIPIYFDPIGKSYNLEHTIIGHSWNKTTADIRIPNNSRIYKFLADNSNVYATKYDMSDYVMRWEDGNCWIKIDFNNLLRYNFTQLRSNLISGLWTITTVLGDIVYKIQYDMRNLSDTSVTLTRKC